MNHPGPREVTGLAGDPPAGSECRDRNFNQGPSASWATALCDAKLRGEAYIIDREWDLGAEDPPGDQPSGVTQPDDSEVPIGKREEWSWRLPCLMGYCKCELTS